MPSSTVKWKSWRARQADGHFWRLGRTVFIVCTIRLARARCAVVVGRCMGRVGLFLGAKSPSVS
jgi:hypothetical protein